MCSARLCMRFFGLLGEHEGSAKMDGRNVVVEGTGCSRPACLLQINRLLWQYACSGGYQRDCVAV